MCNVGNLDRLIRLVLGAGLFLLPFASGWGIWAYPAAQYTFAAIGAALALTSVSRFCPLFRLLGVTTCRL